MALESDLRHAIANGEIHPYFQPLVLLQDESVVGVEILARWKHPERGLIMPDDFIPLAVEAGLMPEMTSSLLRRACAEAANWPEDIFIALNISPSQLKDPALSTNLLATLADAGFPPHRLEIEVTEAALMTNLEVAKAGLITLKEAGVRIALDDFGTGHSSLARLRQLTFDRIKIDRSFVMSLQADPKSAKIVEAIIQLGKSLSIATTAEGIENTRTACSLKVLGCEFGQGYHYGRPVPATELEGLLDGRCSPKNKVDLELRV
jgi:EAL domain-containing protein (putative c-di-GMP-specific phosphodiesterase class I)